MNEKIENAMKNARASLEINGLSLTEAQIQLVRDRLKGKITEEEFLKKANDMATNKDKK
ncbi:antitoxin VbhA family protein [Neobacillus sp. PS2-9]|uniref:antitoxin VbhA family protein n=1 Tax=Neobacillus sp. PS2-9 TaxID=3070676 RepID=UPI0027E102BD|nr:antitoxin VbhA family protein [Neobacillus sp. PS2-9]WML60581.1 antitoxin VbhA family protein [Neobacillus sp. PS2-9]